MSNYSYLVEVDHLFVSLIVSKFNEEEVDIIITKLNNSKVPAKMFAITNC